MLLAVVAFLILVGAAAALKRRHTSKNTGAQSLEPPAENENRQLSETLGESTSFARTASSNHRPANFGAGMLVNPLFAPSTHGWLVATDGRVPKPTPPRGAERPAPADPEYTAPGEYEVVEVGQLNPGAHQVNPLFAPSTHGWLVATDGRVPKPTPPRGAERPAPADPEYTAPGEYEVVEVGQLNPGAHQVLPISIPESGSESKGYDHLAVEKISHPGVSSSTAPYEVLDAEGTTWATDRAMEKRARVSTVYDKLHATIATAGSNTDSEGGTTNDGYETPVDDHEYRYALAATSDSAYAFARYASAGATNAAVQPGDEYDDPYGNEDQPKRGTVDGKSMRCGHPGGRFAVPFTGNSGGGSGSGSGGYEVSDINGHLHSYESTT